MLSRDLFASVIKTFFAELDDVRDGGKYKNVESAYAEFYVSHFKKNRDWFFQVPVTEITTFFADDPIHKLEMLAELMYRDVQTLSDTKIQAIMHRKIIELYEVIDARSQTYSVERMERVTELKRLVELK